MASICDERVDAALREAVDAVVYEGERRWRFLVDRGSVPAWLQVSGDWMRFAVDVPTWSEWRSVPPDHLWWVRVNACLEGPARVALPPWQQTPYLIADAQADETDLSSLITSTCSELAEAAQFVDVRDTDPPSDQPGAPSDPEDIARVCKEHGWECRADEGVTVQLGSEPALSPFASSIGTTLGGAMSATVTVTELTGWPPESVRAVAGLLMRVSGAVNSVKGAIVCRDATRFVTLSAPIAGPLDRGLNRALSALTVACRVSGREALALRDVRLAARYLALFDRSRQYSSSNQGEEQVCLQQP